MACKVTSHSEILQPIQRIYPLEESTTDGIENMIPNPAVRGKSKMSSLWQMSLIQKLKTNSGRLIKMPDRLIL